MTTEVITFRPNDDVADAMRTLLAREVDGAPVVDDSHVVIGVMTTGDLIVREIRLHFPTVLSIFGASIEFNRKSFDEDIEKALGSKVGDVMSQPPITCEADDTLGDAATLMHEHGVSRLPVVESSRLVGIVSRGDILRGMLAFR